MSCSVSNQEENPILDDELDAVIADIEDNLMKLKTTPDDMLSKIFKALEVEHWGTKHDDRVIALRQWSREMGREARSHLAYHLNRIELCLISKK